MGGWREGEGGEGGVGTDFMIGAGWVDLIKPDSHHPGPYQAFGTRCWISHPYLEVWI